MTAGYVSQVASKWFWDKEIAVTAWGNLHSGMVSAHYNRTFKRSTLGEYSIVGVHFIN
jgi:processing peptidase subunit beta